MSVVGQVSVDTVPAGLQLDLSTKTVRAVCVLHVIGIGDSVAVVQANEADTIGDGTRGKSLVAPGHGRVVVVTSEHVTGEHLKSRRERFDVRNITTTEVVDGHRVVGDFLESTINVLIVKLRSPVTRFVRLNLTRGARRLAHGVEVGSNVDI